PSERTTSSHACSAAAGSASTSTSRGHVASASPRRIPGRTPAASAAAVTGPISGSPPGSGESAAGRSASDGAFRKAASRSKPGMERQAIIGTYVLYEHTFPCQLILTRLDLADETRGVGACGRKPRHGERDGVGRHAGAAGSAARLRRGGEVGRLVEQRERLHAGTVEHGSQSRTPPSPRPPAPPRARIAG